MGARSGSRVSGTWANTTSSYSDGPARLGLADHHKVKHLQAVEDTKLLDRARAGDPNAFTELVRPELDRLRRFAFAFAGNWADADDLAQEALVKAYRSLPSFRGESSLSTWLYAVARSTYIDSRRGRTAKSRAREDELDDHLESPGGGADELLERRREIARLWSSIQLLEERFRVPLVLCDIEGMSYDHVATVEEIPVGTVRSRLSRARAKLLELLSPESGSDAAVATSGTSAAPIPSHSGRRQNP